MKRVLTAIVLVPLVLLAVLRAPLGLFAILCGAICLIATYEYLNLAQAFGFFPYRRATLAIIAITFAALAYSAYSSRPEVAIYGVGLPVMAAPFLFLLLGMRRQELRTTLPSAGISLVALPYLLLPFSLLVLGRFLVGGWFVLLFILITVWTGDIAAYYAGKNLGRIRLAPRISPNKSWEGAVASFIASVVAGILLAHYAPPLGTWLRSSHLLPQDAGMVAAAPLWLAFLLAGAVNIAGQFGDLVESMLKRGASVKDSGSLLPGHGGVLDRIDALLFALPVGVIIFVIASHYFIPFL